MPEPQKVSREILRCDGFRFELRPYSLGVAEALYRAADESRQAVGRWMAWMHPAYDLVECEAWVGRAVADWDAGTSYQFVIFDSDDGQVVGSCGLNMINRIDLVCNLGYWVRTSKCGLGAAGEAARLIWRFGIDVVALNRLEIVVAIGNGASQRVAEKIGAIDEGVQRSRLRVGEEMHDARMFACLRE